MNKAELLTKIKGLQRIEPSESWVASNKSFVFDYIKTKEAGEKSAFVFSARGAVSAFGMRFAFGEEILGGLFLRLKNSGLAIPAVSAAMVLVFGGNFMLARAAGSLPGDALYPLKLTAERIQLSLALNEDKRAALTFEFTEKRLNEYYLLTTRDSNGGDSDQNMKIAAENLKTQLGAVSTELESAKSKLGAQKTVAMAKIADSKTAAYGKKLKNTKAAAKADSKEVAEIIDKVDEVNTSALTVLAANSGASDSKEVAAKVEEKIKSSEEKIGLIEQKILAVMVEQEKNNPPAGGQSAAEKSKDGLTPKLISEAKGILEEARSALANNDHSKALELIMSSDQISKVAEKIVSQMTDNTTVAEEKKDNISNTNTDAGTGAAPATETPKDSQSKTETNTVNTQTSNFGSPTSIDSAPAEK